MFCIVSYVPIIVQVSFDLVIAVYNKFIVFNLESLTNITTLSPYE